MKQHDDYDVGSRCDYFEDHKEQIDQENSSAIQIGKLSRIGKIISNQASAKSREVGRMGVDK